MLLGLCGAALATDLLLEGNVGAATALLLVFLVLAGVTSPLIFPKSIGALEAQARSAAETAGRSSSGGRAASTASDCASGWAATPAGCTGSTSGVTRQEPRR